MLNHRLRTLIWIFIEKFGLILLSMVTFVVYAHLLTPTELGIGTVIIAVVEVAGILCSSMLEDPLVRLERLEDRHIGTVFWFSVLVSLVSILVIWLGVLLYTTSPVLRWMTVVASVKILFTLMARVYVAQLRRTSNFKLLATRTLLGKIAGGIGGVGVALLGLGPWAVIAQALIMEAVSTLVLMRAEPRRIPLQLDREVLGPLLKAGVPVAINVMSSQTLQRGVNVLLGLTAGAHAVGMFNLAMRIIDLPRTAIYNGLMSYALPAFARRSGEPARLEALIGDATAITGFLLTPLFIGIALTAQDLIPLVFGAKWHDAIPLLQVLACTAALGNLALFATTALVAVNRTQLTLKAEVGCTLLALALVYLLGPVQGGMAAALALLVRTLMITPLQVCGLRTAIGYRWRTFFASSYRSMVASLVMAGTVTWLSSQTGLAGYPGLACDIAVGTVVYAAAYSLLHPRWPHAFKLVFTAR